MTLFRVVWLGQMLSLIGSMMSGIALSFALWQRTGQVSALSVLSLLGFLPAIALSGLTGRVLDRHPLKRVLLVCSAGGLLATAAAAMVWERTGNLPEWAIYVLTLWLGSLAAVQQPTLMALVPALLKRDEFMQANGFVALAQSSVPLVAPALTAFALKSSGLGAVLWADVLSYGLALVTVCLLPARPAPAPQPVGASRQSGGVWSVVTRQPALKSLLVTGFVLGGVGSLGNLLLTPLILSRTGHDSAALGLVLTTLGAGGVMGGFLLTTWRTLRRAWLASALGLLGVSLLGLLPMAVNLGLPTWLLGSFFLGFCLPLVNTTTMTLWQQLTPGELRGRVFALRLAATRLASVLTLLLSGPVIDRLLTPLSRYLPGWQPWLGPTDRGVALSLPLLGAALVCVAVAALLLRREET